MAAPTNITCTNLNGIFPWNKKVSDDVGPFMELQGIPWILRKAMAVASFTLKITHDTSANPQTIDMIQSATGMPAAPPDNRVLDWSQSPRNVPMIGREVRQTRIVKGTEVEMMSKTSDVDEDARNMKFLNGLEDQNGNPLEHRYEADVIQGYMVNDNGATMEEVWAFEVMDGVRRLTRRILVVKDGKSVKARFAYDYKPLN